MQRKTTARATASTAAPPELLLIETKLFPARMRPGLIVRERLLGELDRLSGAALTLVVAPVGFGKTMLVRSWCSRIDAAVAWISLDTGDNDPARLWTYVAAAVDRVRPGLGRSALARLHTPGVETDVAVDALLEGVNAYEDTLVIVVDDLHVLTDEACNRSLQRFVEHLPSHARVIATTRSDPPVPLGRLRAHGTVGEIRARDLAFSVEEARELLVDTEGIALEDDGVEILVERTEGWPAGLYLASLWLRELDDPSAGVEAFHGDHRHVADYLTGEVLDTIAPDQRRFLLETSALGTFSAAMCDAVLELSDSEGRLHVLERENGFLIALDARGEWYRYHHLFGELLQLELATVEPDAPPRLHTDASAWCREHGRLEDALDHAAAAGDSRLVAEILAEEHRALLLSGRLGTVLRWCTWLPEDDLLERPALPIAAAFAAGLSGTPSHVRHRFLALAERTRAEHHERWTPYHETTFAIARAGWVEGDLGAAIALGRGILDLARQVPEAAVPALASLGFLLFFAGNVDDARRLTQEALDRPEVAARPHGHVLALSALSHLETEAGHPGAGESTALEALAAARQSGVDQAAAGGAARLALASALTALGRLREAEEEAVDGERLRRQSEPEAAHLHALLVLAGIRARRGRLDLSSANLDEARRGLATFTDAGRLPELASEVERVLEKARAAASLVTTTPSAAELDVLRLLATDLSQREIGTRLYISVNTVKTHTRALYRKLGVTSRDEAVARAAALGILESTDSPG